MQVENHETEKPQKNICVIVNIYFYAGPEIPQVEILYWQGQRTGKHAIRMKLCMCKDFCNMYNQPPYCTALHRFPFFLQSKNEKECQKRPWKIPSRQSIINKQFKK